MDIETAKKLIKLLKKDRKKVLQILTNLFKDFDGRIEVPNELLEEIFIKKETKEIDGKETLISKFIVNKETENLYKYFDFNDFKYENLFIEQERYEDKTLDLMRDNNITFYTNNIVNKKANNCNFKNIIINGNFDGWDIEGSSFIYCIGLPEINPCKTSNKSIKNVKLGNTIVTGNCDYVDITGASFENAIISDDFTIDPQKVKNKDLTRTTFSGVKLIGSFDNTIINGTNFNNCQTKLVLDLNKINPGCKKVLKYNKFGGITFKGDLSEFELDSNDFTNSKNAIIDFDNSAYIHISSKGNIFSDVTFRNIRRVSDHFLFDNRNNFTNATISYNSYNCEYELNWYNKIKNSKIFKDIILINEDRELEEVVKQIINPEITKQKIKKMESNQ